MANSKSIGVAFLDQNIVGADTLYADGEIGYTAAAQGAVTQATDKTTGVTLNKSMGRITMSNAALSGNTAVSFTLTNSLLSAKDVIVVCVSGGGTAAAYSAYVSSMTSGSAVITLRNLTGTSYSEAVIVNFAIIHGAP
jgi:1-aminocyclopropane-1-carboxylate deaminase/D-cysteine desulfhydrase-like pyridoxal-dependent ACC family enzyme